MLIDGAPVRELAADDRGLAYGDGVFRTMRVDNGRVIAWPYHHARLAHDCAALGMAVPNRDALASDIQTLCGDAAAGVLKIVVTRGSGGRGYAPPDAPCPRRIVSLHDAPPTPGPLALSICPVVLATPTALPGVKHLNRLEQVLARQYCERQGVADAAMCDAAGRVVCTSMRNLIFMDGRGHWWTPDLGRAGVIGATRERLRAALPDLVACDIQATALCDFTAAIACNSVGGAVAVTRLGERTFTASPDMAAQANALLAGDG